MDFYDDEPIDLKSFELSLGFDYARLAWIILVAGLAVAAVVYCWNK